MPPFESVFAVLIAGIFLSATPGPSMLYVLSRSVGQSRAAGLASAVGLGLGGIILAIATALGLATLFAEFPTLVVVLKYAGSVYLLWLGASMIWTAQKAARTKLTVHDVKQKPFASIVWQGVLVEVLNPKTVLFFALFLPPFVAAGAGQNGANSVQSQLLILGMLVPLTALPSDILVAFTGGTLSETINRKQGFRTKLGWVGGLILILIALNIHLGFL